MQTERAEEILWFLRFVRMARTLRTAALTSLINVAHDPALVQPVGATGLSRWTTAAHVLLLLNEFFHDIRMRLEEMIVDTEIRSQ